MNVKPKRRKTHAGLNTCVLKLLQGSNVMPYVYMKKEVYVKFPHFPRDRLGSVINELLYKNLIGRAVINGDLCVYKTGYVLPDGSSDFGTAKLKNYTGMKESSYSFLRKRNHATKVHCLKINKYEEIHISDLELSSLHKQITSLIQMKENTQL